MAFTLARLEASGADSVPVNVWRVPFAGGDPQPLTSDQAVESQPRWSADGERIAFLSRSLPDRGPARIFVMASGGGAARAVTGDPVNVLAYEWSKDGSRMAYAAAGGNGGSLAVVDVASGRADRVAPLAGMSVAAFAWSPDGASIAAIVADIGTPASTRLVVAPIAGAGTVREMGRSANALTDVIWSPDSRTLAWLAGAGNQPARIMTAPAAGGATSDRSMPGEGAPTHLAWTGDGRLSIACTNGRETWIDLLDPATGRRITVMPPGIATVTGAPSWSADGTRFAVTGQTTEHPPEVFAGMLPIPLSGRPDTVGAPPPAVRRLTVSRR